MYSGIWGFSPFLTGGAMASTFFAPSSARVVVVAVMACLFTVGVQVAWTQVQGDTSGGLEPPVDLVLTVLEAIDRYCSSLLPRQDDRTSQIQVNGRFLPTRWVTLYM